jgi:hypothetical protein
MVSLPGQCPYISWIHYRTINPYEEPVLWIGVLSDSSISINGISSMEQRPSPENDAPSGSQPIICLLRKLTFHYRFQKSPLINPTISQLNPVHTFTKYVHFLKTGTNILFHLCPGLTGLPLNFTGNNFNEYLICSVRAIRPTVKFSLILSP